MLINLTNGLGTRNIYYFLKDHMTTHFSSDQLLTNYFGRVIGLTGLTRVAVGKALSLIGTKLLHNIQLDKDITIPPFTHSYDIWGVGLIIGQLLGVDVEFSGQNGLSKQIKEQRKYRENPFDRQTTTEAYIPANSLNRKLHDLRFYLLHRMLDPDPKQRATATEALDYFRWICGETYFAQLCNLCSFAPEDHNEFAERVKRTNYLWTNKFALTFNRS